MSKTRKISLCGRWTGLIWPRKIYHSNSCSKVLHFYRNQSWPQYPDGTWSLAWCWFTNCSWSSNTGETSLYPGSKCYHHGQGGWAPRRKENCSWLGTTTWRISKQGLTMAFQRSWWRQVLQKQKRRTTNRTQLMVPQPCGWNFDRKLNWPFGKYALSLLSILLFMQLVLSTWSSVARQRIESKARRPFSIIFLSWWDYHQLIPLIGS